MSLHRKKKYPKTYKLVFPSIKQNYENCANDFIVQNEPQQKTDLDCDTYDTNNSTISGKNTEVAINSKLSEVKRIKLEFADNTTLTLSFNLASDNLSND